MTYRTRSDHNQKDIVRALRVLGADVADTHNVGNGFPDLVVKFRGQVFLLECKNLEGRGRKLTDDQKKFHAVWNDVTKTVTSIDEAYRAIGAIYENN